MTVEPPHDEAFSIEPGDVQPRTEKNLRHDLWEVTGGSLDDVDEWIATHGRVAAEEKILARWSK